MQQLRRVPITPPRRMVDSAHMSEKDILHEAYYARLFFFATARKLKDEKTQGISKNSSIFSKTQANSQKTQRNRQILT